MTVIESVAGLAVIGVVVTLATRATVTIDRAWRLDQQHRFAIETLRNAMEYATALPWDDLTEARLATTAADVSLAGLPNATVDADVVSLDDPAPAKRVTLELTWTPVPNAPEVSRSLTAWVYERGGPPDG